MAYNEAWAARSASIPGCSQTPLLDVIVSTLLCLVYRNSHYKIAKLRYIPLVLFISLATHTSAGHADSVYKLKDASGATVYSDRPDLKGTTNAGTVNLDPGPSDEAQQAARQNVQRMQTQSEELRQSRMGRERQRGTEQDRSPASVEEMESTGVGTVEHRRLRDPKTRIPVESPGDGEHPIYEPREGRPVHIAPRPRPRAGR